MGNGHFPIIIFPNNLPRPDVDESSSKTNLYLTFGILIWAVLTLVISALVFRHPLEHTVTPVYHMAVEEWFLGETLYADNHFHYFPQFVFIFLPFHVLPAPLGDILWRMVSVGLFSWGLWRVISLEGSPRNKVLFLYASLIAMAPCFDSIRNGQANVIFAALTIHAAASLARSRWWVASLCLLGALVCKPIGLVMVLLAAVVYRVIIWRITAGLALLLVSPLLFTDPSYVFSQYRQSAEHLLQRSIGLEPRFADLNGLLRMIGVGLSESGSQIMRLFAGLFTVILWWVGATRMREPERAWLLLGITTTYLMLFNPMTEVNSYIIVAPSIALYAVHFLEIENCPKLGWGLIFMGVSIGLFPEILRRVDQKFGLWWDPLMMLFFLAFLLSTIFSKCSCKRQCD